MQSILVVDDDYAMRRGIALMLKGAGYEVFEAEDGATACRVMSERSIDLAVIDLFLGEENGMHVAGSVLQHSPGAEVLILTAHGEHKRAHAARKTFKERFLEKSSLEKKLLKTIEEVFRSDSQITNHKLQQGEQ